MKNENMCVELKRLVDTCVGGRVETKKEGEGEKNGGGGGKQGWHLISLLLGTSVN